jgi:hypothetical protein
MKLPTGIVTKNKIRDSKICSLYAQDALTYEEIATRFGITATRVGQILYKNRSLLEADKRFEKIKRVNTLKRMLHRHPANLGNKTTLDIVDSLRQETEGRDGIEPVGRNDSRVIIIRETIVNNNTGAVDGNTDQGRDVSRSLLVVRE